MKQIATIGVFMILVLGGVVQVAAQQDALFSQYMFNGLVLNPAYAGSRDVLSVLAQHRSQWVGMEGAPTTQTLSAHSPLRNEKFGLGLMVFRDKIGIFNNIGIYGSYAYRIPVANGKLAFGIQGGVTSYQARWADETTTTPGDNAFSTNSESILLPNAGFGVYYNSKRMFFGASVPYLLTNELDYGSDRTNITKVAKEDRNILVTAGYVYPLSTAIELKPTVLLKYVANAPAQLDINANALFFDVLWGGIGYRTGGTMLAMVEYQINNQFSAGYSFDLTLGKIAAFNSGSHEIMIRYEFGFKKNNMANPRYF